MRQRVARRWVCAASIRHAKPFSQGHCSRSRPPPCMPALALSAAPAGAPVLAPAPTTAAPRAAWHPTAAPTAPAPPPGPALSNRACSNHNVPDGGTAGRGNSRQLAAGSRDVAGSSALPTGQPTHPRHRLEQRARHLWPRAARQLLRSQLQPASQAGRIQCSGTRRLLRHAGTRLSLVQGVRLQGQTGAVKLRVGAWDAGRGTLVAHGPAS